MERGIIQGGALSCYFFVIAAKKPMLDIAATDGIHLARNYMDDIVVVASVDAAKHLLDSGAARCFEEHQTHLTINPRKTEVFDPYPASRAAHTVPIETRLGVKPSSEGIEILGAGLAGNRAWMESFVRNKITEVADMLFIDCYL
jgi:hypothetical protein